MAHLTSSNVHNDKILANLLIGWRFDDFVWEEVSGKIKTDGRESDEYITLNKKNNLSKDAGVIAPGDPSPIKGLGISTDSFTMNEYAISTFLADRTIKNADAPLKQQLRNAAAVSVMDDVQRKMEFDVAAAVFDTSIWDTDITGSTTTDDATHRIQWNDYNSSTPVDDFIDGKSVIRKATAKTPNRAIINDDVWDALQRNPEILVCLGAQERGFVTIDMLAQFLGLDKVVVGSTSYNSANEATTDPTITSIWGKNALLYYYTPAPQMLSTSSVLTFEAQPIQVRRWREDDSTHRKVEFVEASVIQGYKIVDSGLGYFWDGIVA